MTNKIRGGVHVRAYQRANEDEEIEAGEPVVRLGPNGELMVSSTIGHLRGNRVEARISLEELQAWLPEMVEAARKKSAEEARQALIEEIKQQGYKITTMPSIKITPRSGA